MEHSLQPAYQGPVGCVLDPAMMDGEKNLNRWHFVTVGVVDSECVEEELEEFYQCSIANSMRTIEAGTRHFNYRVLGAKGPMFRING
mgnify:CR=1 FL=1